MSIKLAVCVLLAWAMASGQALTQQSFVAGSLPSINFNTGLQKGWGLNFKWESRQSFWVRGSRIGTETGFEYLLSDVSLVVSKKVGLSSTLAAGYLMRIRRDGSLVHRSLQQLTLVGQYRRFRLGHRFSTDQTFFPNAATEFRVRYRLTAEIPLQGDAVDAREWYVKVNNEYLNSFQNNSYDLELRLVPLLGYAFSDSNKLELGLDYRMNSFLEGMYRGAMWISGSWYLKI